MSDSPTARHAATGSPTDPVAAVERIQTVMHERFGTHVPVPAHENLGFVEQLASRRVRRAYSPDPVSAELIELLCACALSAPSKSDLQQRDIIVVDDPALRATIAGWLPHMPWVEAAPALLIFCANPRRVQQVSALRDKPFPNNHMDLFFNAIGDAAIALATCLHAAESLGLGACPISEIRNRVTELDQLLGLPDQVVPFAGLCLGWPVAEEQISPRLPLPLTVHRNRFDEGALLAILPDYDRRREGLQPYLRQYQPERWGVAPEYGWSEQKARQYAVPQRLDFGAYIRAKGFVLE